MLGPEAVREDAEAQVDATAAEEQRAHEEDAGGEDAHRRVGAAHEVLIDRAGALVLAGEDGYCIRDREHAETGDEHRERGIEAGARYRGRDKAKNDRRREHRADRKSLCDGVDRSQASLAQLPFRGSRRTHV